MACAFLLSFRTSCKAQILFVMAFCFSRVELYQRQRERATEGEKRSERRQRQRGNATQHHARLNFLALLGFFSARWYSRQGGTAKGEYKRFFTASRLTAWSSERLELGTATEKVTRGNRNPPMRLCARKLLHLLGRNLMWLKLPHYFSCRGIAGNVGNCRKFAPK